MSNRLDLPPEILGLALSLLHKGNLKEARQVSKAWEKAAVPYLFDQVFMSPSYEDLATAEATIDQFGYYIKTLTFSAVHCEAMCWTVFRIDGRERITQSQTHRLNIDEHLSDAYEIYRKVRKEQMEILEKGTCLASLCRALRRLPNLQKLVLKDLGSEPFGSVDNLYYRLSRRLKSCQVQGCQLRPNEHLGYLVRPQSGFLHEVANSWNLAMLAWWAVGSPVRELAVESWADLPLRSFVNTVQRPCELKFLFQNLTKLRLNLLIDPDNPAFGSALDACCFREGIVSQALSGAKNLQCLYIRAKLGNNLGQYKLTSFQAILGTCHFPNLRSLILNSLESTMEELLAFLGASPLRQLTIIRHGLHSGSWEQAADWTQSTLQLKEVDIDEVYPLGEYDAGDFYSHYNRVQDFFFRDGPNPFSEETLAVHLEETEELSDWGSSCIEAAEERYHRYH